jgi:hypothetical protein
VDGWAGYGGQDSAVKAELCMSLGYVTSVKTSLKMLVIDSHIELRCTGQLCGKLLLRPNTNGFATARMALWLVLRTYLSSIQILVIVQ